MILDPETLPEPFLSRMEQMLGREYPAYLASLKEAPFKAARINTLKHENTPLPGFDMIPSGFAENSWLIRTEGKLGGTPEYLSGVLYPQEPAASLPVTALGVRPGMMVLDLCAAPGSKSTQIAELLDHSGLLVCNEIVRKRAEILKENIERHGIANAVVLNSTPQKIAASFGAVFDAVLADAPCSGEGMFRREEDAVTMWSQDNVLFCARRQKEILEEAAKCVKPGGRLLYSTCTFSEEENEENVQWFLDAHPEFELVEIPGKGHHGTAVLKEAEKVRRIYPMDGGEGQFLACFQKEKSDDMPRTSLPVLKSDPVPKCVKAFLETELTRSFPVLYVHKDQVYGGTHAFIDCRGNALLRHQTYLGAVSRDRFEPSHALALSAYASFVKQIDLNEEETEKYRRGETIRKSCPKGWIAVRAKGFVIGLAKSDGMILKNHYPKSFRIR